MPAIEIPTGYTRDEWTDFLKRGRRVIRTKSASNFELGDLLIEMLADRSLATGEVTRIVGLFARQIRSTEKSLKGYRYVAAAWPADKRRDDVPWTVHRNLAPDPNRFELIRQEPSDELDPHEHGVWTVDASLRARQNMPGDPATPHERVDHAKRLLRATDEAAQVVTQLADRTEVIKKAVEDPAFRRAVRDASRELGRDLEERAAVRQMSTPAPPDQPRTGSTPQAPSSVSYRDTPSSVLKILGQCTSFCVSMQNAVVLVQEEMLDTEEETAIFDSLKKVRAVCDWCEHVVTTGQSDMDEALVHLLDNPDGGRL
jgi:hypothetical protein